MERTYCASALPIDATAEQMKHILLSSRVVLAICVVVLMSRSSGADSEGDGKLLEQVQQAKNLKDLAKAYEKACETASKEELDRLKTCRQSGIAIRAAWEEIRRTIPADTPRRESTNRRINSEAMQRFLGFVEGRLPVRLPWWWKDAMARADYIHGTADSLGHGDWEVGCLTNPESSKYLSYAQRIPKNGTTPPLLRARWNVGRCYKRWPANFQRP